MLLRSVNCVEVHCDCGRAVRFDEDASATFMHAVTSIAQGYRPTLEAQCGVCKRPLSIDKKRAEGFLAIWTI